MTKCSIRLSLIGLLALVPLSTTGCGTIFTSDQVPVVFDSQPQGARVTLNGVDVGKTPIHMHVNNRQDHIVRFELRGMEAQVCMLSGSVGAGWVVLDVLFTGLIGVVVDAVTKGWRELDNTSCHVHFRRAEAPPSEAPVAAFD